MNIETKEKANKGNTFNIGLINNSAQANTDITATANFNNNLEIKAGIIPFFKSLLGSKTYKFIGEYKYNKTKYEYNLAQRINAIPEENIIKPRLSVAGPVLESLKYNLDEEHIKEMYTNILISEVDKTKQNRVLPAYIEIIKQINRDDALFIKNLKDMKTSQLSLCFIRLRTKGSKAYVELDTIIVNHSKMDNVIKPQKIVLENLERLNIIKLKRNTTIPNETRAIENAFEFYKNHFAIKDPNTEFFYTKGVLEITDFGQNFINICCS